jgi:predicted AlkP superfamily pyrophosphatase or phosphodiesterase
MNRQLIFLFSFLLGSISGFSQSKKTISKNTESKLDRPKLIVGIVVDQMRYDFLYRFYSKYCEGGFKRMLREGYSFANCNYSYFPTKTAAGHASIYTGTTPNLHGVVGNDWFEPKTGREMHCVQDDSVRCIGGTEKNGRKSPKNLQTFTVADQIKLATNFRGKTFGISLKDRGAILPAGHSADGAFWFDATTGNFISSTFYKNLKGKLPDWLDQFNQKRLAEGYKKKVWTPLFPMDQYFESSPDFTEYESGILNNQGPVFPYDLSQEKSEGFEIVKRSPFGNTLVSDVSKALISGEKLGRGTEMDFLAVSFSSTDEIGHNYGAFAIETEDTYLRLDRDLESFFTYLDNEIGKGNYLAFFTADHGIIEVPSFLMDQNLPAGYFSQKSFMNNLKSFSVNQFDSLQLIKYYINEQIFLDHELIQKKNLDVNRVVEKMVGFIENQPDVFRAFALTGKRPFPEIPLIDKYEAGYFKGRSGDIQLVLKPGMLERSSRKGTNHTSPYSYDTHVPCLWLGWKIKSGETTHNIDIQDIAPTLSSLLHIMEPNGSTGKAQPIPLKQ